MKKIMVTLSILSAVIFLIFPCHAYEKTIKQQFSITDDSKEIIYRDAILSLFVPYMQKEINNYYKDYLTEPPMINPYSLDIVNVRRLDGYRIQFEIITHPYIGPHITISDDKMIIETRAFGLVEIKNFEHVKSYPLPWNLQSIIKKPY